MGRQVWYHRATSSFDLVDRLASVAVNMGRPRARGGDVSNVPSTTGEDTGNTEDVAHANGDGPRRSVSECQPNTRV
jgi:hypothetical protein